MQTAPVQIKLLREAANPWYEVTLVEGRNRQIRRMFEEIGHHVEKIKRVRYGPLQLDVDAGKFRSLTAKEVGQMKSAAGAKSGSRRCGKAGPSARTEVLGRDDKVGGSEVLGRDDKAMRKRLNHGRWNDGFWEAGSSVGKDAGYL